VTYTGTLTLAGASGTITASLAGQVFGPSRLGVPIRLTYTITRGTGAYAGVTGAGRPVYSPSLASQANSVALTFGDADPPPPPPPAPPPGATGGPRIRPPGGPPGDTNRR